jgi:hypothetical protein
LNEWDADQHPSSEGCLPQIQSSEQLENNKMGVADLGSRSVWFRPILVLIYVLNTSWTSCYSKCKVLPMFPANRFYKMFHACRMVIYRRFTFTVPISHDLYSNPRAMDSTFCGNRSSVKANDLNHNSRLHHRTPIPSTSAHRSTNKLPSKSCGVETNTLTADMLARSAPSTFNESAQADW